MKCSRSIAQVLFAVFGLLATFAQANEFLSGHRAYQIEVADPEGVRVARKICVSAVKLKSGPRFEAADASEEANCQNPELYGAANDIQTLQPMFDESKKFEVGRLYNRQGEESKWVYFEKPSAHRAYLRDEHGQNGKWIWVCSAPIVRDEDKLLPEVLNKTYDNVDPRYLRVEFCTPEKTEMTIVTGEDGKKFRREMPHCPAAKTCLEKNHLPSKRIVTTPGNPHAAQTTSVNQEIHNINGGR